MTDSLPPERWLAVLGYEGLYEVSDLGRVRSTDRESHPAGRASYFRAGRPLRPLMREGDYRKVNLYRDGKCTQVKICSLVLSAFTEPRPAGMVVRHGPGGMLDDRLVNLCWGTPVQNAADKIRDGTELRGERNGNSKLTAEIVLAIRNRRRNGEPKAVLAQEYGISVSQVYEVTHRQWRHLKETGES